MTLCWIAVDSAASQVIRTITESPTCSQCKIEFKEIATLGDRDGPGMLVEDVPASVTRDRTGHFWVTFFRAGEPPMVFDSSGRFVATVGRTGAGPNEFQGRVFAGRFGSDTVFVLDDGNARLSVYLDYKQGPLRTQPLAGLLLDTQRFLVLTNGTVLVNTQSASPERAGSAFHRLLPTGVWATAFGSRESITPATIYRLKYRMTLARSGDAFWAARSHAPRLERWTLTGTQTHELTRELDWFPDSPPVRADPSRHRPSSPEIVGIREDSNGLLWIVTVVSGPRWEEGIEPFTLPDGRVANRVINWERRYDTVVDIVNPATGTLIKSVKIPGVRAYFVEDGILAGPVINDLGNPAIKVWLVTLSEP